MLGLATAREGLDDDHAAAAAGAWARQYGLVIRFFVFGGLGLGRWLLSIAAKIEGEPEIIEGEIIFRTVR